MFATSNGLTLALPLLALYYVQVTALPAIWAVPSMLAFCTLAGVNQFFPHLRALALSQAEQEHAADAERRLESTTKALALASVLWFVGVSAWHSVLRRRTQEHVFTRFVTLFLLVLFVALLLTANVAWAHPAVEFRSYMFRDMFLALEELGIVFLSAMLLLWCALSLTTYEQRVASAEARMGDMQRFLRWLFHQVRTPLNNILLASLEAQHVLTTAQAAVSPLGGDGGGEQGGALKTVGSQDGTGTAFTEPASDAVLLRRVGSWGSDPTQPHDGDVGGGGSANSSWREAVVSTHHGGSGATLSPDTLQDLITLLGDSSQACVRTGLLLDSVKNWSLLQSPSSALAVHRAPVEVGSLVRALTRETTAAACAHGIKVQGPAPALPGVPPLPWHADLQCTPQDTTGGGGNHDGREVWVITDVQRLVYALRAILDNAVQFTAAADRKVATTAPDAAAGCASGGGAVFQQGGGHVDPPAHSLSAGRIAFEVSDFNEPAPFCGDKQVAAAEVRAALSHALANVALRGGTGTPGGKRAPVAGTKQGGVEPPPPALEAPALEDPTLSQSMSLEAQSSHDSTSDRRGSVHGHAPKQAHQGEIHDTSTLRGIARRTLRFSVSDTGVGMTPDVLQRLLTPFAFLTTSHTDSGGLSLTTAHSLVQQAGGGLTAQSPGPGQGAVFHITLPVLQVQAPPLLSPLRQACNDLLLGVLHDDDSHGSAPISPVHLQSACPPVRLVSAPPPAPPQQDLQPAAAAAAAQAKAASGGATAVHMRELTAQVVEPAAVPVKAPPLPPPLLALVVDDAPATRKLVGRLLKRRCGAQQVMFAGDGQEAVNVFREQQERHASGATGALAIGLITMDMQMPVMDGLQATRAIRNMSALGGAEVPIIGITGNALGPDVAQLSAAGANVVCTKPLQPGALHTTVASLLQKPLAGTVVT